MSKANENERTNGFYQLLSSPFVYDFYQKIVGGKRCRKRVIQEYSPNSSPLKVLDIGCGTGYILDYLPDDVNYTGYDLSEKYIKKAIQKYGHRARFFCQRISHLNLEETSTYDLVIATGVLHHLNNEEGKELFQLGFQALKPGGKMITEDGTFIQNQNKIAKFIIQKDRGLHVRKPKEYQFLAKDFFANVTISIRHDLFFIPFTSCVLECYKPT